MPYQAEKDATIPRVIAEGKNDAGEVTATYESVTYAAGAVIYENDIAPHILRRLEQGDDHLSTLLRAIDDAEAREILGQQAAEAGVEVTEGELLHEEERLGTDSPTVEPGPDNELSAAQEVADTASVEAAAEEEVVEEVEVAEEVETETAETEASDEGAEDEAGTDETESETETADESEDDGSGDAVEEEADAAAEVEETEDELQQADILAGMSKQELNREARSLNIQGRSKMNEEELCQAIIAARAAAESETE